MIRISNTTFGSFFGSSSSRSSAPEERQGGSRLAPENATLLINCLFAMVFAAILIGTLSVAGLVVRSSSPCPAEKLDEYSDCEIMQDVRAMLSFLLGALICSTVGQKARQGAGGLQQQRRRRGEEATTEGEKLEFHACLL